MTAQSPLEPDIITKHSSRPVADTVSELVELVTTKGMTVFAVIDQAAQARKVGLELRATTLVIFGNPVAGTAVMDASPLAALDLPLKILVWADGTETRVSYLSPEAVGIRYGLADDLVGKLRGIHALTDAVTTVEPS